MPLKRVHQETPHDHSIESVDVAIIGAGWSGLGAANVLLQHGVHNFVILEAQDHVGGRSVTNHDAIPGCPVDLGSAWVHGDVGNPIKKLLDRYKLPYGVVSSNASAGVWTSEGHRVDSHQLKQIEKYKQRFMSYMHKRQYRDHKDKSLEAVLQDFLYEQKLRDDKEHIAQGLRWALDTEIVQEYAADLSELSLWWWDNDEDFQGKDLYLGVENGGYSALIEKFASWVMPYVRLNSMVQSIDYGQGKNAVVSYIDKTQKDSLQTHIIKAKHVVVTLPLGVLQSGSVKFSPPLPREKQTAMNQLGNGLLNKCILYWEDMSESDMFWPAEQEWIEKIQTNLHGALAPPQQQQGHWTEFYNAYKHNGGIPMLVGFTAGSHARRMETLSDDQVKNEVLQSLRDMFGHDKVPEPTKVVMLRWGQDDYARGSYSFVKPGGDGSTRKKLGKTVGKQVWFAGEATHELYPSTTHGALLSGEAVAGKVVKRLGRERAKEKGAGKRSVETVVAKGVLFV